MPGSPAARSRGGGLLGWPAGIGRSRTPPAVPQASTRCCSLSWRVGGAGPYKAPGFVPSLRSHPRPAPHAPALPPAAEALVRLWAGGRSAPMGARPCPAPSQRAPPLVPANPYPLVDPFPPSALVGSAPARAREYVPSQDLMVRKTRRNGGV